MAGRVFIALRLFTVFFTLCWIIKAPNEGSGELFTSTNCRDGVFPCFLLKRRYLLRPYETPRKKAFAGQRVSYYNNSSATTQFQLLKLSGNVHLNPGPKSNGPSSRTASVGDKCSSCARCLRSNQNGVQCSSCHARFHIKCSGMTSHELRLYHRLRLPSWSCITCSLSQFSDSFFSDSLVSSAGERSINTSTSSSTDQPMDWYRAQVMGYYKKNLTIAYLNVNSIYGKADEVLSLLETCQFDVLLIAKTKIDGIYSNSLLAHPSYRIIRRDRMKGGGGILVYVRTNLTAYRRKSFEPEGVESICLDIKGCGNAWFMVCGCYRSEKMCNISDFITSCEMAAERMLAKRKEIIFAGDYNMDMNLSPDIVHGPHQALFPSIIGNLYSSEK